MIILCFLGGLIGGLIGRKVMKKHFEREHSPLLAIRDAYPKMIIARTHHETYDYQGVQVVDICRWLRE